MNNEKLRRAESLKAERRAKKHTVRNVILICLGVIVLGFLGGLVHMLNPYRAEAEAYEYLDTAKENGITVTTEGRYTSFMPAGEDPVAGFIFYPGANVESEAYIPLMELLAEKNVFAVLVDFPLDFAFFGKNSADEVRTLYPEITSWYIGGHSLGGAVASMYLEDNYEYYDGLVLLGSYCYPDLSQTDLKMLSVYGTEDGILNRKNYEKHRSCMTEDAFEVLIKGGCHSYFGDYGMQHRDGNPTITREEQLEWTATDIYKLITMDYE